MKIVEVKNLYKKYDKLEVIKDVSFDVNEGETLVILGASGSGKSTMLRCINNLEKIDGGNIIINGRAMIKEEKNNIPIYNDKKILNQINLDTGMIFQDFNLFPHLSVKQNIMIALTNVLKIDKSIAEKKAEEVLEKMDLLEKKDSYPCDLSGGQKQRVSIARSLAINPKILCMDEPTSALDPELVGEVLKVIKKLAKEKTTMIIVTHEIKFAEEVADRIIFMDGGKIIEMGTPEEVIKNPKQIRTREFLKRYIDINENKVKRYVKRKISKKEDIQKKINIKKNVNKQKIENGEIKVMEYITDENIDKIEPKDVINFFKQISNIPRESGNEKGIRDYLVKFAEKRKLEYYTDEYFNVIIRKEASKGFEDYDYIGFQAHTDMICEKIENSNHDFTKDSIKLIKDGDFIKADNTTLGADNGIGVAIMLALLNSKEIKSPKLECIFTSEEETTMIGAIKIDESKIKTKRIISLDNGKDDKMVISSANCMEWFGKVEKEYQELEKTRFIYELKYSNFKGGHSGGNISDIKRGNPIKLGIEILSELEDILIINLEGGSRVNVIPRDFKIIFASKKNIKNIIEEKIKKQKKFYGEEVEINVKEILLSNLNSVLEKSLKYNKALSEKTSKQIINFIKEYENGALKFDEKNNTILSGNFAAVRNFEKYIQFEYSLRSNNLKLRDEYLKKLRKIEEENNIEIIWKQELFGVEPDYDSKLVSKVSEIYKNMFNKELEKIITQGVVEGGFFKNKIKNLEYICIGANTFDVHSPKERVSILSIQKVWKFLKELLEQFNM